MECAVFFSAIAHPFYAFLSNGNTNQISSSSTYVSNAYKLESKYMGRENEMGVSFKEVIMQIMHNSTYPYT